MTRRIDVELTSARDDGTWTWRAAGAKQPKGVLDAALLFEGAKVGDVIRAEAEFEIDGITITSILPPREKKRSEPERIEVRGQERAQGLVTSSLVSRGDRPRTRDRDRPRPEGGRPSRSARAERPDRGDRAEQPERRGERAGRPRSERPERPAGERRESAPVGRPAGRGPRPERTDRETRSRPRRFSPPSVHRAAVVATLPPEQRPIAEQVLRGGIPAVRQAVEQQNAALRAAGQPEVRAEPLIALAEELLPRLRAADWRDRAEAAVKETDEIGLRDLRSVVAGADAGARDDETRLLASTLREALDRRVAQQRTEWLEEIGRHLDGDRVLQALRVSARAPDPTSRFPSDMAVRLAEAAGQAMTPEVEPAQWAALLEAVVSSPVRRTVKPAGLPRQPGEELLQAARHEAGRIPALASLLGISMPPPPGPPRASGRPAGGRSDARRRPPPPPSPRPSPPPAAPATSPDAAAEAEAARHAEPANGAPRSAGEARSGR